jgi:TRAP transporter TAXI family solute receptor
MRASLRRASLLIAAWAALAAVSCARAADEAQLETDLQTRLDRDLAPGLFDVVALRREGSAPASAGESGTPRVIVYFNATLRLVRDYSFGSWDQLGPSSVAYALGATDKGVFGLQSQNRSGDIVRAYGRAFYEETPDGWIAVAAAPPDAAAAAPDIQGSGPSLRSKQLIDRLAGMVNLPPPGVTPQQDEIIAEELARASENIERRVQRRAHTFTLATGPEGGEYARFAQSLIEAVNAAAPDVKLRQRASEGSVDNMLILSRGEADYAIVQADVAAAAAAGDDVFARGTRFHDLRAVGALFPEAVHIVVLADSRIHSVSDLRGKRVDIGAPASGTRFDALAVLEAHGLAASDLAEARGDALAAAVARLRRRQLHALFVTTLAPTRALQQLAVSPGLRLLPIADEAMGALLERRPGLTPLTLAANTYPQQARPIRTVASAALLTTTAEAPDAEVARVADLVFRRMPAQHEGSTDVVRVSPENARRGITIPLHPGVARHDGAGAAP